MIKIGVMSDSHGLRGNVRKALEKMNDCDVIAHLGDHAHDIKEAAGETEKEIFTVSGNCDWFSTEIQERLLEFEGVRVLMTHGHREGVKGGMLHLSLKAEAQNVQLALFGHTHIPAVENDGRCVFVNPGALKDGRYAIVEIENGNVRPFLKKLDDWT